MTRRVCRLVFAAILPLTCLSMLNPAYGADSNAVDNGKGYRWTWKTPGNMGGWTCGNAASCKAVGGRLKIKTKRDFRLISPPVKIDATTCQYLVFRLKSNTSDRGEMFFNYDHGGKKGRDYISLGIRGDGRFHNYLIRIANRGNWRGKVTKLRFDPVNKANAKIEIEYLQITDKPDPKIFYLNSRPAKILEKTRFYIRRVILSEPLVVKNEADFFSALDLHRPGMEAVKKAVGASDWTAAKKALLAYMRNRKSPRFVVDRRKKDEIIALVKKKFPRQLEKLKKSSATADNLCRHDFSLGGFRRNFKGKVEWDCAKTGMPFVFNCPLVRMRYLNTLGQAWWMTGDKKYAQCARELVQSHIESCPMPPQMMRTWSPIPNKPLPGCFPGNSWGQSLEVAERMGAWVAFHEYFIDSDVMTPEFHYRFLSSLLEHGRYMYEIERLGYIGGNWPIVECNGLARVVIMFPEFRESALWWKQVKNLFAMQIKKSVLPDGVQTERTSGYHGWCMDKFRDILLLGRKNGVTMPKNFAGTVGKMELYIQSITYPGRQAGFPALGDGPNVRWWTERSRKQTDPKKKKDTGNYRLLWKLGLDAYAKWEKRQTDIPSYNSTELPYAGLFVMRNGWRVDDKFLLFDCVPIKSDKAANIIGAGGHWHASALNVDIYAYGRALIVDPGSRSYSHPGHQDYVRRAHAHNIIEMTSDDNRNNPKLKRWMRSPDFDLAEGKVRTKYARISRRVLFVKPDYWIIEDRVGIGNARPMRARGYWHLNSRSVVVDGKGVKLSTKGNGPVRMRWMGGKGQDLSFHTNDAGIGNILVIPDMMDKYVSLTMIADTPCGGHVACYQQDPNPPTINNLRYTTLLYPFKGAKRPAVSFKSGVVKIGDNRVDTYFRKGKQTDGNCALISRLNGKIERILLSGGSNVKGVVRLDGKAAFLIITRKGKSIDVELIGAVKVNRIELPGFDGIKRATVNGKPGTLSEDKGILFVSGSFEKIKPDPKNTKLFWIIR